MVIDICDILPQRERKLYVSRMQPGDIPGGSFMTDGLPVLESTRYVVEHSKHVTINRAAARQMLLQGLINTTWYPDFHLADPDWIFVLDALNFCFWEEPGQAKWSIEYHGETLSGYWALAASLKRAVEESIPLMNAEFLATISSKTVEKIFRGDQRIPLSKNVWTIYARSGRSCSKSMMVLL